MTPDTSASERWGLGISNCRPSQKIIEAVKDAEDLGASVAFIAEDIHCRDTFALASLCARETETIRLATGVVNPYTRNPAALAMGIATVDEVSGGRAILGLGTSSPSLIEDQMGISTGKPIAIMRETSEIVRALLGGDRVDYNGNQLVWRNVHMGMRPVQARVPIFFAAMGPMMLRLAGSLADGVLLNVGASVEYVRWAVGELRAGAEKVGRDPGEIVVAAWMSAYVTSDSDSALQRAREWLATMLSIPRQGELLLDHAGFSTDILVDIRSHVQAYPHAGDRAVAAKYVPVEVAESLALIGTPGEIAFRVDAYRSAGVDIPVLGPATLRAVITG